MTTTASSVNMHGESPALGSQQASERGVYSAFPNLQRAVIADFQMQHSALWPDFAPKTPTTTIETGAQAMSEVGGNICPRTVANIHHVGVRQLQYVRLHAQASLGILFAALAVLGATTLEEPLD